MSVFDETTTFNVVLSFLLIFLKICSVSDPVNLGYSTTQVVMPVLCLNTSLKLDFQNNNQIAKSFSGERLKFFVDETTTFNVVLSYLHINLKICSVSESANFGFSTTQVSIPVLRKHTKVSMAEPTHCNILILCQLTIVGHHVR